MSRERFFEIVAPYTILLVLNGLYEKFIVVFSSIKKQIRVDKTIHRKEYGLEITRRKHFESYFLKFINKFFFRKIAIFYMKWVKKVDKKYYDKFKNGEYTLSDCYVLIPIFILIYIYRFFVAPRTFYYYTHYLYYLALPMRFKNVSFFSFRARFSFM